MTAARIWTEIGSINADIAFKNNFAATTNPGVGDDVADGYSPGSMWVNITLGTVWVMKTSTLGAATWINLSSVSGGAFVAPAATSATGAGSIASITGGAGGATSGDGGAAKLIGGAATAGVSNGGDTIEQAGAKSSTGKDGANYHRGAALLRKQGAPAAKTTTAVITGAELVAGLITTTGATGPSIHQLPTGADIDAELPGAAVGDSFDFTVINTGTGASNDATVTANTDVTIVGNPTVGSLTDATIISGSGTFRARRTAAHEYVVYRLA